MIRTKNGLERSLAFLLLLALAAPFLPAEPPQTSGFSGGTFRLTEKHNYRKKSGGAYVGAVYREVRGLLRGTAASGKGSPAEGAPYDGRFFVLEETKRQGLSVSPKVETSFPVRLSIAPGGAVQAAPGERFPTLRGFPALPEKPPVKGERWQAFAVRALDPDFSGRVTPVKVLVEYRSDGRGTYKGFEGEKMTAKYAVRYRKGRGLETGDPALLEVSGTHDVSIFLASDASGPRLYTETFKEQYRYEGGRETFLEGTILTFFEGVVPLDRPGLMENLKRGLVSGPPEPPALAKGGEAAGSKGTSPVPGPGPKGPARGDPASGDLPGGKKAPSSAVRLPGELPAEAGGLPDIDVEERPEGLALVVKNLKFKADRAELLPEETGRLELLARTLAGIPQRTFLVVGHTADIGRPEGQQRLSEARARAVADALVKRGIPAQRLLHQGKGGTEPAASNADEEGRAKNRRVEIMILED